MSNRSAEYHCKHLHGTDGLTCKIRRGKPSQARYIHGHSPDNPSSRQIDATTLFRCIPAETAENERKKIGNRFPVEKLTNEQQADIYSRMVSSQLECNKFKEGP